MSDRLVNFRDGSEEEASDFAKPIQRFLSSATWKKEAKLPNAARLEQCNVVGGVPAAGKLTLKTHDYS